jgi:hypothetical protein
MLCSSSVLLLVVCIGFNLSPLVILWLCVEVDVSILVYFYVVFICDKLMMLCDICDEYFVFNQYFVIVDTKIVMFKIFSSNNRCFVLSTQIFFGCFYQYTDHG